MVVRGPGLGPRVETGPEEGRRRRSVNRGSRGGPCTVALLDEIYI